MLWIEWIEYSNEQWIKYTVADNIEIEKKNWGKFDGSNFHTSSYSYCEKSHMLTRQNLWCVIWVIWLPLKQQHSLLQLPMNYDFCIFSSKNYLFHFDPDLKVIASKVNFIHDNKSCNFSLILWSEPQKIDGH